MNLKPLFIQHATHLHTSGFAWLEIERADYWAMSDIEENEHSLWKYIRPQGNSRFKGKTNGNQ